MKGSRLFPDMWLVLREETCRIGSIYIATLCPEVVVCVHRELWFISVNPFNTFLAKMWRKHSLLSSHIFPTCRFQYLIIVYTVSVSWDRCRASYTACYHLSTLTKHQFRCTLGTYIPSSEEIKEGGSQGINVRLQRIWSGFDLGARSWMSSPDRRPGCKQNDFAGYVEITSVIAALGHRLKPH